MNSLGLVQKDWDKVSKILRDVESSVSCEVGIAGSLAQRALSPRIKESLLGQRLSDVDLLILGTVPTPPELPELRIRFKVMEVVRAHAWYYGMIHRATNTWVDLFAPAYERRFGSMKFNDKVYKVETLESQMLYLAYDVLRRVRDRHPVRLKWLRKINYLKSLTEISWERLEEEYTAHSAHFSEVLSQRTPLPSTAAQYIDLALSQKETPRFKDWLFLLKWQFFLRKVKV